ncbi:MAG TPA: hypothetical protein VFV34_24180 [Blastocatellia bacterium]|nr:hypothetical protein [Blastocatellia bacterium]
MAAQLKPKSINRSDETPQHRSGGPAEAIKHQVVDDVNNWILFERSDENLHVVGSITIDRYLVVPESKKDITVRSIEYLDGTHDLIWIQRKIKEEFGKDADIVELFMKLRDTGLIKTAQVPTPPQSEVLRNSIRLFQFQVGPVFQRLRWLDGIFAPPALAAGLLVIALGFTQLDLRALTAPSHQVLFNSHVLGYITTWLCLLLLAVIHESFHGLAGTRYGLSPRSLSGALYLGFIPYVFITIPGVYTISPRRRIVLWAAGIYSNLLIGSALLLVQSQLEPGSFPSQFLSKVILANLVIVIFNLSPFMATDSYFILSTLFKSPNVRTNSFTEFKKWIRGQKNAFGPFLATYFVLSAAVIGYFLVGFIRWIVSAVVQAVKVGITVSTVLDLWPLALVIATIMAQRIWRRISQPHAQTPV